MVGGAFDYTVSNFNSTVGSSGFSTLPSGSYGVNYAFTGDVYTNFQQCTFATCGGQALYEASFVASVSTSLQAWSRDHLDFVTSSYPWMRRGGAYGGTAGVGLFNSRNDNTAASEPGSFRVGSAIF
jgi:hypothetical protein